MLLLADGRKVRGGPYRAVVFDASGDFLREVVAELDVGRKDETLSDGLTVEGFVEGGIEAEIPAAELFINDGAHFPGPSVGMENWRRW